MRRYTLIGIVIIIIVAVLSGLWLFARTPVPAFDPPAAPQATSSAPVGPRTPPAGYTEYRDTTYHLSLFYPSELSLKTYDEGGGAATIDFQNVQKGEGFQIFIVPYSGMQVTAERFKEDEPSGVRNNPTYGLIDGASASSFYSTDASLGDTYEVWFIHGGYLYEVTTLKPLDAWLQNIMQTWLFI
jgi:hypothetical protein